MAVSPSSMAERLVLSPRRRCASPSARPCWRGQFQDLVRRVGLARGREDSLVGAQLAQRVGELLAIDFAAPGMQIHGAVGELRQLGKAAGDGEAGQRDGASDI